MEENKLKITIAKNITYYRKKIGLTQIQLADKINYSDKAISKWERGEAIPDIFILIKLCEIFSITINDLIKDLDKKHTPQPKINHLLISILSVVIVWIVAVLVFVILSLCNLEHNLWLTFLYAVPISCIVLVVFTSLWANKLIRFFAISSLIWSLCIALVITFNLFFTGNNYWTILLIGIPVQLFFIFGFLLKKKEN